MSDAKRHTTKLTEQEVKLVRQLYFEGGLSLRELAEKFDITHAQVHNIVRRKQWRDVN